MNSNRIPTDAEKIRMYEDYLHKINLLYTCMNHQGIARLVQNADSWGWAHRQGNGELSDEEQEKLVAAKFWKLLDMES